MLFLYSIRSWNIPPPAAHAVNFCIWQGASPRSQPGFLIRPLGALMFGWMRDRIGRKYTFVITLSGMALGTGAIGLIPIFESPTLVFRL
jgi:hypothetical protein